MVIALATVWVFVGWLFCLGGFFHKNNDGNDVLHVLGAFYSGASRKSNYR